MRSTRDQLYDLCVIGDVREPEPRFAVGNDVKKIQASRGWLVPRLQNAVDLSGPGLRIRTHGFLLLGRQSPLRIAGRKTSKAHGRVIGQSLLDAEFQFAPEIRSHR